MCDECKESVHSHYVTDGKFTPPPQPCSQTPCNSHDIKAHYSFDYAQQVHFPSDPLQLGPIYFLTPRKCTVFGVNCEALPRQVNFLTDEVADYGKGANAVVIISSRIMVLERRKCTYTWIIAAVKIRIIA